MAEYPAMPLWTDAYLADTRHLSTEEHGAYLLLLMEAWRRPTCALPDDDALLARLAGLPLDRWTEIRSVIMGMWTFDGRSKTWHQKKQRKERDFVHKKSASQAEKAAKRWAKTKKPDAAALPDECRNDAPTPTPTVESSVSKDTGAAAPKVDPEKVMFDAGVALLTASGKSERDARSMVGMWRKQHGAEAVISAVGRAQREGPVDAVAFMQGIFRQKRKAGPEAGSERVRDGQREVYEPAVGAWVPQWG